MITVLKRIMSSQAVKQPIVAVIGTTGVGKSQLAVSLAQSLIDRPTISSGSAYRRGVVLSADSMQLYKGLDVITNKVTQEEMGGVEHWGLDIVTPGQGGSWEMGRWCGEATKKIESLDPESLPIVCGGTHYFIQHFLFPPSELSFTRPPPPTTTLSTPTAPFDPLEIRWKPPGPRPNVPEDLDPSLLLLLDSFWTAQPSWPKTALPAGYEASMPGPSKSSRPTTKEDHELLSLHRLLAAVDTTEAGRWHWRDGRKVKRGLERWWERGGGEVASTENNGDSVTSTGRKARYRTLIFWVYEPIEALRPRLDRRVDRMVENGLLREIAEMRQTALNLYGSPDTIDHTEGIFQSIGYKEFAELSLPQSDPTSDRRYSQMLSLTKQRTHQYAKSQLKWIRKQLLPVAREARGLGGDVEIYVVPGGEAGEQSARAILHKFLQGETLPPWNSIGHSDAPSLLSEVYAAERQGTVPDTARRQVINSRIDCELCSTPNTPYSVAKVEWDAHMKSRVHQRNVRISEGRPNKIEEQLARREAVRAQRNAAKRTEGAAVTGPQT